MNKCVKSIYIWWVGLSRKNKAYDIKGLPTPIPIKEITHEIVINIDYVKKHNIDIKPSSFIHTWKRPK